MVLLPWNKKGILEWVILFFAAMNVIFLGGKRRAFGSYVAELRKDYPNITLTELNWIGDSYAAFGYMSTSLSTFMIIYFNRRYALFQFFGTLFVLLACLTSAAVPNPHWLFLTHTVFHGIGSSLILSTIGLVINEHFAKDHPYRLLATTLVSGGSVASIVFVALFAYLIQAYNWRIAFVILGAIYFIVNGSASIFFRKNDELKEIDDKLLHCDCSGIRNRHIPLLVLWFIDRIMTSVVTYGLLLNLTDYVHRTMKDLVRSTVLTTLFAAGEASTYLLGAIIMAVTKDFFKNKLRYILIVTASIMCACLFLLEFFSYIQLVRRILCFVAGFCMGPSITFLFPAGEELTKLPGHMAYPFSLGGMGFGMMISPVLTAKIAETFKYKWFFFVQGALIGIKILCLAAIIIILRIYRSMPNPEDYKEMLSSSSVDDNDIEVTPPRTESPTEETQLLSDSKEK